MYDEGRYNRPKQRQEKRELERALLTLKRLGYQVDLADLTAAA